ncbi:MAG TPA: histidine kinase [Gaiella sp.]
MTTTSASPIAVPAEPRAGRASLLASLQTRRVRVAIAAAGLVAATGGGLLVATSDHLVHPATYGAEIAAIVAGTIATALYWLVHRPGNPIAVLLVAYAAAVAGISLQGASSPLLHSIGVLFDAPVFFLGFWLVFAFPHGRVTGILERVLLAAIAVAVLTSFLPWFFFSPVVSGEAPLATCTAACPENALMLADRASIANGLGTAEGYYLVVIGVAITVALLYRFVDAATPRRRALLPVYVPALLLVAPFVIFHAAELELIHLGADTYDTVGWLVTAGRTTLSLGLLLAIAQAAVFAGLALRTIMSRVGHGQDARHLRALVADVLDDPSLELAFGIGTEATFVDSRNEPLDVEHPGRGRASTAFRQHGRVAGYILHDDVLASDPELLQAAGQAVLLSLESGRLASELQSKIEALRRSRDRIVAAGETERRRIERDLHDGAQQRLMAIQVKLAMAAERAADDELASQLEAIRLDVGDAVDELRTLSHGIYPSILLERGVGDALRSIAMTAPLGIRVTDDGLGRCSASIETAVYFCALEAIQNTIKHAGPGARVTVLLSRREGAIDFMVSDDGIGMNGVLPAAGMGLVSMQDRIGAVGGELEIVSSSGRGTMIRGTVPDHGPRLAPSLGVGA